jgi:hypothetical protein
LKEKKIVAANISQICFLSGSLNKLHLGTFDLCLDAADFFDEKKRKKIFNKKSPQHYLDVE